MFRIVFLVEDKNLAKVLHATTGLVLNMEAPQPVVNASVIKTEVKQKSTASSIKGRFTEYLSSIKGARVTTTELREKWVELGGMPSSLNGTLLSQLKEEGHVIGIARGQYRIT